MFVGVCNPHCHIHLIGGGGGGGGGLGDEQVRKPWRIRIISQLTFCVHGRMKGVCGYGWVCGCVCGCGCVLMPSSICSRLPRRR